MTKRPWLQCSGPEWEKARMACLVRDNFQCQAHKLGVCSEPCIENRLRFLQVHHIKMRIAGGTHDLDNLITICRKHHADIHPWLKYEMEYEGQTMEFHLIEL